MKNGTVGYEGGWKNDLMDGMGLARILGGVYKYCVYKGPFVGGKKQGGLLCPYSFSLYAHAGLFAQNQGGISSGAT